MIIDPVLKTECMDRTEAQVCVAMFREIGGFSVDAEMIGNDCYGERGWRVIIRLVNAKAGNRNSHQIERMPANLAEAKKIAKEAKAKWKTRDQGSLIRAAAERQVNAE